MTFYYSCPGLFQEKSQLQSTQTAQFSRCMERNARYTPQGREQSALNHLLISSSKELFFSGVFFCWGVAFLGEKLNSLFLTP